MDYVIANKPVANYLKVGSQRIFPYETASLVDNTT